MEILPSAIATSVEDDYIDFFFQLLHQRTFFPHHQTNLYRETLYVHTVQLNHSLSHTRQDFNVSGCSGAGRGRG